MGCAAGLDHRGGAGSKQHLRAHGPGRGPLYALMAYWDGNDTL